MLSGDRHVLERPLEVTHSRDPANIRQNLRRIDARIQLFADLREKSEALAIRALLGSDDLRWRRRGRRPSLDGRRSAHRGGWRRRFLNLGRGLDGRGGGRDDGIRSPNPRSPNAKRGEFLGGVQIVDRIDGGFPQNPGWVSKLARKERH